MEQKALKYFRRPYNCAQTVLKAFQGVREVSEEDVTRFSSFGGGRAEDGLCGALYGALFLAESDEERQQIKDSFLDAAGSLKCREIRKLGRLSCHGCVETAAVLTKKYNKDQVT